MVQRDYRMDYIRQGRVEGKLEMAKKLLELGTPFNTIVQASGLPSDVIENLVS